MSNAKAAAKAPSVGSVLLVSQDAGTVKQLSSSMEQLAMFPEVCAEVGPALTLLSQKKFEAVVVDLQLGTQTRSVLEKVRLSPSNRTAVIFAISASDAETAAAFKDGSNFVLRRPLSAATIDRSLKVAYGMIVRERRRYFRCPVEVPVAISGPGIPAVRGKTLNISEGGVAINTSLSLKPGVQVKVQFTLPDRDTRFEVDSTVCWSKEGYLGFQFTSLSHKLASELQEWLSERLEETFPESVADKFRSLEPPESGEGSDSHSKHLRQHSTAAVESQNWVTVYRAAVSELDPEQRLPKVDLAKRSMKKRWSELAGTGPKSAEERQKLNDALEHLHRLLAE